MWPFKRKSRLQKTIELFTDDDRHPLIIKLDDWWSDTFGKWIHWYFLNPYRDHFGRFPKRIKKVLDYLPLLWYDFDWDHSYLYKILKMKLDKMIPVFENGMCVSSAKNAHEMKICSHILGRLIDDIYSDDCQDELERKYGKIEFVKVDKKDKKGRQYRTLKRARENHPNYKRDRKRLYERAQTRKKEDLDLLFNILRRKIEYYWD